MFSTTKILLSAAIILGTASAAMAMTKATNSRSHARDAFAYAGSSSRVVISNGRVLGQDPDFHVRLSLIRDAGGADKR